MAGSMRSSTTRSGGAFASRLEGALSVADSLDREARALEGVLDGLPDDRVVLHHEDR